MQVRERSCCSIGERPPVSVLPPCINLRRFASTVRSAEKNGSEQLTILFLSRLEPRKGASVLLQALANWSARGSLCAS